MVSIIRLARPCPCGSGKPYGDCCAGGKSRRRKKTKRRKREEKDDFAGFDFGPPSSPRPPDIRQVIAAFSASFAATFNKAIKYGEAQWGDDFADEIFRRLEVSPGDIYDASEYFCVQSYALFRHPQEESDRRVAMDVRQHVRSEVGDDAYDKMSDAQMAVWRLRIDRRTGPRAERVDGLDADPIRLAAAVDSSWEQLTESGTYVGWLVELQERPVLFFAARVDGLFEERFSRAARRQPWGNNEGESFRSIDYEEDALAMLLDPECIDTERDRGRIFLSPWIDSYSMSPDKITWRVCQRIHEYGLPVAEDDEPGGLNDLLGERYYCASCDAYHFEGVGAVNWSIELATILSEGPPEEAAAAVLATLREYRDWAVADFAFFGEAFGPKTAQYLLPDEALAGLVHLSLDGHIDDPRVADADRYRIEALGLDPARLRAAGVSPDWTIAQGLAWASQHADDELVDDLAEAAQRHRVALGWSAIVAKSLAADSDIYVTRVAYSELIEGLEMLIPAGLDTPISELEDRGRNTWGRLERALRNDGGVDAPVIRLRHLPHSAIELEDLHGVGDSTITNLLNGMTTFVANWPGSAGHRPLVTTPAAHRDEQAAEELSRGLDELDELF
ncbi:MAG: SEC-C domain-containing protein [Persicimonas sp.]